LPVTTREGAVGQAQVVIRVVAVVAVFAAVNHTVAAWVNDVSAVVDEIDLHG